MTCKALFPHQLVGINALGSQAWVGIVGGAQVSEFIRIRCAKGLPIDRFEGRLVPGIVNERRPRIDGVTEGNEIVVTDAGVEHERAGQLKLTLSVKAEVRSVVVRVEIGSARIVIVVL